VISSFWFLWRSSKSVNEPKAGGGWMLNMKQRDKCKTLIVAYFHKENANPNNIICITMPLFLEIIKILGLQFPWRVWIYRITRMSIICRRNLHIKNKMPFASNERLANCNQSGNGNVIMLPFLKKLHKRKQGKGHKRLKQQLQCSFIWP
jgi:hypothetical protein